MKIFTKLLSRTLPLILLSACAEADLDCDSAPGALPGDRATTIEVPLRLHTGTPKPVSNGYINPGVCIWKALVRPPLPPVVVW